MDYFFEQMRALLGSCYSRFIEAYDNKPRHKALRVNTLKISVDDFLALTAAKPEYALGKNALCLQSFYKAIKPSYDPLYHAGLYYMQEPSASAAVEALSPYIGKRVLDLCAAPGGKSTQAATSMSGGIIFCNDVDKKRVGALEENLSRLGVTNAVTTCAAAKDYRSAGFDGYFDTLIVDAPCSGGGMMRYENVEYSKSIVEGCAARQREILNDATELLAGGGYMLYSTCTFSPEENEQNVAYIMSKGFEPVDVPLRAGEERGIGIAQARRIYPHNFDGEGHFYCVLRKTSCTPPCEFDGARIKSKRITVLGKSVDARVIGDRAVTADLDFSELPDCALKYRNIGARIFEREEIGRPSYEFCHASTISVSDFYRVELDEADAARYIRGEQIRSKGAPRGEVVVTHRGYALGLGKLALDGSGDVVVKNFYPKHSRIK